MKLSDPAIPFTIRGAKQPRYQVSLPRDAHANGLTLRSTVPMTIAPPISGEIVHTADNRPEDPANWQNEPGPGVGELANDEIVRRQIGPMEQIPRVRVPRVA